MAQIPSSSCSVETISAIKDGEVDVAVMEPKAPNMGSGFKYFSLPAEIRNQIMTLVLCPGDIYLRPKPSLDNGYISYSNDPDGARLSPPGIQLLATCQQAYDEGHNMYYSSNIFHLPPGPLDVTKALFDKFLPKHVALIRHISFRASSMDMTPAMLEQVDEMALHEHNYTYQPHSQRYGCKVLRDLDQEWVLKAIFMVTELPAVNSITFETAHKAATIDRNSSTWEIDSVELCSLNHATLHPQAPPNPSTTITYPRHSPLSQAPKNHPHANNQPLHQPHAQNPLLLPAEIRNEITSLALTGGHVYLEHKPCGRKLRSDDRRPLNGPSAPGANFLATCRQAYGEGRGMYYTRNIFHLPAGSSAKMKEVLDKIKPEHLAVMRQVYLKLSLLDLTPSVLRAIDKDFEASDLYDSRTPSNPFLSRKPRYVHLPHEYGNAIHRKLNSIWKQKLKLARSSFTSLEDLQVDMKLPLHLKAPTATLLISNRPGAEGRGVRSMFELGQINEYSFDSSGIPVKRLHDIYVGLMIDRSSKASQALAERKIKEIGWEKFKRWIGTEAAQIAAQ